MSKTPETGVEVNEGTDYDLRAARVVAQQPNKTRWGYFWDTLDKSPEERKFLFKLDTGLLTVTCLGMLPCRYSLDVLTGTHPQDSSSSTSIKPTSIMPSSLACMSSAAVLTITLCMHPRTVADNFCK